MFTGINLCFWCDHPRLPICPGLCSTNSWEAPFRPVTLYQVPGSGLTNLIWSLPSSKHLRGFPSAFKTKQKQKPFLFWNNLKFAELYTLYPDSPSINLLPHLLYQPLYVIRTHHHLFISPVIWVSCLSVRYCGPWPLHTLAHIVEGQRHSFSFPFF